MNQLDIEVYKKLPDALIPLFDFDKTPRINEIILMSCITGLSACMPNVFSYYTNKKQYTHIYTIILALSASDKRYMEVILPFLEKIDEYHYSFYENRFEEFNRLSIKEKLNAKKPDFTIKILPSDITTSSLIHLLKVNPDGMIMFETEAITIGKQLKQQASSFTNILLKCFANEGINKSTYTNGRLDRIKKPKLSILASGTLKHITQIVEDSEDGLFSRICFLKYSTYDLWSNINYNPPNQTTIEALDLIGDKMLRLNKILIENDNGIEIQFTEDQKNLFNSKLSIFHNTYLDTCPDLIPTIRRIGIIHVRICMIFTILRNLDLILENEDFYTNEKIKLDFECSDLDFENALEIVQYLLVHSESVLEEFRGLYNFKTAMEKNLYDSLPYEFTTALALENEFHNSVRTTKAYLNTWVQKKLTKRTAHGKYEKIVE